MRFVPSTGSESLIETIASGAAAPAVVAGDDMVAVDDDYGGGGNADTKRSKRKLELGRLSTTLQSHLDKM